MGIKELVILLLLVILVEFVELYDIDELLGILRIGGIAGSFQPFCPSLIVGQLQLEQTGVSLPRGQKA